jgi:arylsulfatase A-like enzyme
MKATIDRRTFLKDAALGVSSLAFMGHTVYAASPAPDRPNLLFILTDQWRAQATGYAGNPDVHTPHLDRLAGESVNYANAVSTCAVCCPYRASLITGRYPLTHGVFLNDLQLNTEAVSLAQAYRQAGYQTGYIGKWHLDGNGRSAYIPPERRQGFDYWKALECTHNYNHSAYYAGNDQTQRVWPGYDAFAQTDDAIGYLSRRARDHDPFALFVFYGSPHAPYRTGPKELIERYDARTLTLRQNIPEQDRAQAQQTTAGYYAHIEALDSCVGKLMATLKARGLDRNTIVVFTSDHGDMLHSRGMLKKQRPWDEAIRVPFLLRCPVAWPVQARTIDAPLGTPDIMPTILGLSRLAVPATCEGEDLSREVLGQVSPPEDRAALILCPSPFGQWARRFGGREYRGLRTRRYTYARDLNGPWLLYDNQLDPFQQNNLVDDPAFNALQENLNRQLQAWLKKTGDAFLSGPELIKHCGYRVDQNETIGYSNAASFGQVSVSCRDLG